MTVHGHQFHVKDRSYRAFAAELRKAIRTHPFDYKDKFENALYDRLMDEVERLESMAMKLKDEYDDKV